MHMSLDCGNSYKGIKNEWSSEEVIPYIKEQLAEIRNNAIKIVEEAFSGINDSVNSVNSALEKEEGGKDKDLGRNVAERDIPLLKCSQLELLKFLQYSNDKLSKYKIGSENIHFVN